MILSSVTMQQMPKRFWVDAKRALQGGRIVTALLLVLLWALVPITMPQWSRVPHTHVLIGHVTPDDMDAHLAAEAESSHAHRGESNAADLHWQAGWILSIPFGDFGAFLAFVLAVMTVQIIVLAHHTKSQKLTVFGFTVAKFFFPPFKPPPRAIPLVQTCGSIF